VIRAAGSKESEGSVLIAEAAFITLKTVVIHIAVPSVTDPVAGQVGAFAPAVPGVVAQYKCGFPSLPVFSTASANITGAFAVQVLRAAFCWKPERTALMLLFLRKENPSVLEPIDTIVPPTPPVAWISYPP
jgi:hypothetical protein